MSLFENSGYQWRETYFLFFKAENRPSKEDVVQTFGPMKSRLQIVNIQADDDGFLEAMTILAPSDSAGVDVTFVTGEEIAEQRQELKKELSPARLPPEDRPKLQQMLSADARFDLFHFQQVGDDPSDDDILDPGSLLSILSRLAKLVNGIAYDPQSGAFLQ